MAIDESIAPRSYHRGVRLFELPDQRLAALAREDGSITLTIAIAPTADGPVSRLSYVIIRKVRMETVWPT